MFAELAAWLSSLPELAQLNAAGSSLLGALCRGVPPPGPHTLSAEMYLSPAFARYRVYLLR